MAKMQSRLTVNSSDMTSRQYSTSLTTNVDNDENDEARLAQRQQRILIPKASFTSFRLLYATPEQVAKESTVVFLGRIPDVWAPQPKLKIMKLFYHIKDKKVKNFFDNVQYTANYSLKQQWEMSNGAFDKASRKVKSEMNLLKGKTLGKNCRHLRRSLSISDINTTSPSPKRETLELLEKKEHKSLRFTNKGQFKGAITKGGMKNGGIVPKKVAFNNNRDNIRTDDKKQHKIEQREQKKLLAKNKHEKAKQLHSTRTENRKKDPVAYVIKQLAPEPGDAQESTETPFNFKKQSHGKEHTKIIHKMKHKTVSKARHFKDELYNERVELLSKLFGRFHVGEMVKVQKMLVMVKLLPNVKAVEKNLSDAASYQSRTLERWKEYVVVARSTGDIELPLLIQFYTNRSIRYEEKASQMKDSRRRKKQLDFVLDIRSCKVSFYNTLDKSVAISFPVNEEEGGGGGGGSERGVKVYIFKCASQFASIDWYLFIQTSLGLSKSSTMKITIPDLDFGIDILVPADAYEEIIEESKSLSHLSLSYDKYGYRIENSTSISVIIDLVLERLKEVEYNFPEITGWLANATNYKNKLGLAWKCYDRLEWIGEYNQNIMWQYNAMCNSYTLKLRIITHYPTRAISYKGNFIDEPIPVEGFLYKLSDQAGNDVYSVLHNKTTYLKYFFTNRGFLFYTSYFNALPPIRELYDVEANEKLDAKELRKVLQTLPEFYQMQNFEIDENDHFEWLRPDINDAEFYVHDSTALLEAKRNNFHMLKSEGVIDLCNVSTVRPTNASKWKRTNLYWASGNDAFFEVVLESNVCITFEACSQPVRDEWVSRLNKLSEYWKLRKEEDLSRAKYTRDVNVNLLGISEYAEPIFVEKASSWELKKGILDASIYNINTLSVLKNILYHGELYYKPRKHANFEKYYVVLSPGYLILYQMYKRSSFSNLSIPCADYQHHLSIPLRNCYLYSGKLTSANLLHRDRQFDIMNPGHHPLPKIYLDGWKSAEDETSRCFTIWIGTKRLIKKASKRKLSETEKSIGSLNVFDKVDDRDPASNTKPGFISNKKSQRISTQTSVVQLQQQKMHRVEESIIKSVNRLGTEGRSMIFMARSRQEKDLWALNILNEIGRFSHFTINEDIQIV